MRDFHRIFRDQCQAVALLLLERCAKESQRAAAIDATRPVGLNSDQDCAIQKPGLAMRRHCQIVIAATLLASASRSIAIPVSEPPLPTLQEIFPRAVERARREQENDRAFEAQFSFVKSKVTEYRNGKGEIKKREAKISTNNPALKPLAATPATPPAAAPSPVSKKATAVSDTRSNVRGKAFEKDDFEVNNDLVKRYEFTLVGRELVNGRPALVVDFVPAKGKLPERNLKDKFLNKAAGRVWLDEEDLAIAKAALRLTERVNVVGGLVGAVWRFSFGLERERTEDGIWFAREANWHLEGREVFLQRTVDYHEERTDVRRAR